MTVLTLPTESDLEVEITGGDQLARAAAERQLILYQIWTDGSCPENSRRPGDALMGAGIVGRAAVGESASERVWSIPLGRGTNNIAELRAIELALARVRDPARAAVRIYCDSEYTVGILTRSDWMIKKNIELVIRLRKRMAEFAILELVYIKGHSGIPENDRADALARCAVFMQEEL